MIQLDANKSVSFCDGLSRRDFLHAGALTTLGLALPDVVGNTVNANSKDKEMNCIFLFLVGGPSHIDTWDPKPSAPLEIRGPFKTVQTSQPDRKSTRLNSSHRT